MVNIVFKYVLLYFIITFGSISISYVFKRRTCQTLPVSCFLIMIVLYVFGIFQALKIGIYIISIFYLMAITACIIHSIVKKRLKLFIKDYLLSIDFLFFTIIFVVFAFTTYNKIFTACDDYGYWSMATKNMYYLDDFVTNPNSIIRLIYPPFPTTFQYFFEKVIGENRQGIELFSTILFGLLLLFPLFKNIKKKRKIGAICILGIILAIPAIFIESWFYFTIYVDSLLGLLIGYILFEYFTSKKDLFLTISLSLATAVLVLTKPTGVFIALIILGVLGLDYIFNVLKTEKTFKKFFKEFFKIKNLKIIIILLSIIIVTFMSWEIYKGKMSQNTADKEKYDTSSVKYVLKTICNAITGKTKDTEDILSIVNLPTDLFDKTTYSSKPFGMSAGTWICIMAIVSIVLYKYILKENKNKFIIYMSAIFIGFFVYICFLQVAYIIEFPDTEAVSHVSIERYVGTFLISMLIAIIGTLINRINENENYNYSTYIAIVASVIIFTPISPISNITIVSGAVNNSVISAAQRMISGSEKVPETLQDNSKLYVLHQTCNLNDDFVKFQYYSYPTRTSSYSKQQELLASEEILNQIKEFEDILYNEYDYLFIIGTNEYFNSNFKYMFKNEEVLEWTLYEIEKNEMKQTIVLEPINEEEKK